MAYRARIAVTAGLLLAFAMPVTAQDRFDHVQYALRPGDTVFVVDDTGTETRGKVASIGPSALPSSDCPQVLERLQPLTDLVPTDEI
jgi:hypothetical protein